MKPRRPRPAEATEQAVGDLIHGLAELLEPLAGSATAAEILEQLRSAGADAYPLLRSALEHFFPRLEAGELPSAKQLAGRLRAYQGQPIRGARIEQAANKTGNKVRWAVTGLAKFRRPVCRRQPAVVRKGFRWNLRPRDHWDVRYRTLGDLVAALRRRAADESICEHLLEGDQEPEPTPENERELVRVFLSRYDHGSSE